MPSIEAASGYLVGGTADAFTAIISAFNGVILRIHGLANIFAWNDGQKKNKPQNVQQVVSVNVGDKKDTAPSAK